MPSAAKRQRKKESARARQEALRVAQERSARRRRFILIGGSVLAILVILFLTQRSSGKKSSVSTKGKTTTTVAPATGTPPKAKPVAAGKTITGDTPCPNADGSSPRASKFEKAPPICTAIVKKYTATFDTTEGKIVVDLDMTKTPSTTNNFVVLSRYHYYDGSAIFRTDPSIDIIQGGSPTTQSPQDPGPGYTIPDEGGKFTYSAGDLVMARGADPNSASAQFFFVAGPKASNLDSQGTYVTFGKVSQGLDVVQKILGLHEADPTSQLGGGPSRVVTVKSVTITESG